MKLVRTLLAVVLVLAVAGVAYVSQTGEPAGVKMATAAQNLLDTLSAEQKAKAVFEFDSKERTNWNFVPLQDNKTKTYTRKGLPLGEMNPDQVKLALALVKASTSAYGYDQAVQIMSLESILRELEKSGSMVRNPGWYFFTVFGTPGKTGRWGWRVEGHHLSLNFTVEQGQLVSATPAFFGANPASVKNGPRKGVRTIPEADDLAKELYQVLDKDQQKVAYHEKAFPEPEQKSVKPNVGAPVGLPAAKMTGAQKATLKKLMTAYTKRMRPEVSEEQWKKVDAAGFDKVHFAYNGGLEPGQLHTYRVQGPTFVIEFKNDQTDGAGNPANHIHSVWRRLDGDFGVTFPD
jgi:uncharacterized protein DUF3500